jgi:hypothetical protein
MPRTLTYAFTRLARAAEQLPRFPQALALVWTAARRWTIAWATLLIAQGLIPVATVYLTRPLVDSVLAAMRSHAGAANYRPALINAALMAAEKVTAVLRILNRVEELKVVDYDEMVQMIDIEKEVAEAVKKIEAGE